MRTFKLICFYALLGSTVFGTWIAKIDSKVVSTVEFQDFINVQKKNAGKIFEEAIKDKEKLKKILQEYIDNVIVLREASKKGYNKSNKKIADIYSKQKNDWLLQNYLLSRIDIDSISVSDQEMKDYFNGLKAKDPSIDKKITYSKLDDKQKGQIYQSIGLEKMQNIKDDYRLKLEKRYRIKRNKLTDIYVAVVEETKIKKSDMLTKLDEQLALMGITAQQAEKKNKKEFEKLQNLVRDELIFEQMLSREMKKEDFESKKDVKKGLKFFKDKIIIQYFIENELIKNIKVSDEERSAEYNLRKKELERQQIDFEKMVGYLTSIVRQKKAKIVFENFINEKREESVIKRNKEELKKIK